MERTLAVDSEAARAPRTDRDRRRSARILRASSRRRHRRDRMNLGLAVADEAGAQVVDLPLTSREAVARVRTDSRAFNRQDRAGACAPSSPSSLPPSVGVPRLGRRELVPQAPINIVRTRSGIEEARMRINSQRSFLMHGHFVYARTFVFSNAQREKISRRIRAR